MFTRTKRACQLGLLAKDLAAVRWRWPGPPQEDARRQLVERLGRLHGLPQKLGQLLALSELDGPAAYTPLTESQAPLPAAEILALLEDSLRRKWTTCFRSFDPEGQAASLGQVHRAVLRDGRGVAVKIQYPTSAAHVELDLKALNVLTAPFGGLRRGFDLSAYQRAVGGMLRAELDYRQEARAIDRFSRLAAGDADLIVPEVIPSLCSDRVLTMTWVDGEPFAAVRGWPEAERRQVGQALLRLFLRSAFRWRFLHADPHPGNYRFRRADGRVQVGLLDFGCVQALEEPQILALAGLIDAACQGRADGVFDLYAALGFNTDLLQPMAELLPALNRLLFEPFATDGPFVFSSWELAERVDSLLGPLRWNFRYAGPADLIFVVRAYLGLLRYQQALDVPLDWSAIWCDEGQAVFRAGSVSDGPACPSLTLPARTPARPEPLSRHLRVCVQEAGQVRVDLTFKAVLAECLPELVPPELADKLQARQADVARIAAEAAARCFAPGVLFTLTEGQKQVRVWLE